MTFFVGVDAGASNLRLRVEDEKGQLVGEAWGHPSSLTSGAERASESIRSALNHALAGSSITIHQCAIGCGIGGCRQTALKNRVRDLLWDAASVELVADSYAALLGAHGGKPGAVVIAGTGSVGLSLDGDGRVRQYGGWGTIGSDEGSGSWIGREAIRVTLRAMDDGIRVNGADRNFFGEIRCSLGCNHEHLLDWLRQATPARLAAFAPIVLDHAATGSLAAKIIVNRAAREVRRLVHLAGCRGELPVALTGGLALAIIPYLPEAVASSLVEPEADAVSGAMKVARGEAAPERYADTPCQFLKRDGEASEGHEDGADCAKAAGGDQAWHPFMPEPSFRKWLDDCVFVG